MQRRHLLSAVSCSLAVLAGCSSNDESPTESASDTRTSTDSDTETQTATETETQSPAESELPEELGETTALVDRHVATLTSTSFEATEYMEGGFLGSDSTEVTRQHSDAGMVLTYADDSTQYWFTETARVGPDTHTYYSEGIRLPVVNRRSMENTIEQLEFERVEVLDEEVPVAVFEPTGESDSGSSLDSVSGTVEITASGYIRLMDIEMVYPEEANMEPGVYRYEVTGVGDTTVATPEFAESAVHIEGQLRDDQSAAVLEHAGGATVESGTRLRVTDAESNVAFSRAPSFPSDFAEGDTAYVYFTGENEAAITVGEEPSNTGRTFETGEEGDTVFVEEQVDDGRLGRFRVIFGEGSENLY